MKSVAIKGIKEFEIKEIDSPNKKKGKVLIEVKKAGICGSDIHYWDIGQPIGLVMGHEFSGVVLDNGGRSDLKVGDRVTALPISPCNKCSACLSGNHQYCLNTWTDAVGLSLDNPGALTEKILVREDMVVKLPDEVNDEEGAMIEPTAVGLHAVNLANIKLGDKVLIVGGGIIGLVSALLAKKNGASYVCVSEVNEKRGKRAVSLKVADEWLDAKDDKKIAYIKEKTNEGFDKVIECCGNSSAVTSALTLVKNGGTVVLVGVSMTPINIPTILGVMHELTIKGAIGYTKEEFNLCIDMVANKEIDILKFLDKVISYEEVQSAYEELTSNESSSVKILVDPKK